ncbi:glucose-6-phosphate isomerase [Reyranella sp.]|uniref:glucose-6-phosphate isomerase n=1 Tax=Reyranella sp. TaxID=1929291 RepID=UPI003D0B4B0D
MFYSHITDNALEAKVKGGLSQAALDRELQRATPALDKIRRWREDGTLPLLKLPARRDDLEALKPHAERFAKFEHVVVMGSGGSSLSGKTLVALKDQGFGPAPGRPKVHFMDNVDPATFAAMTGRLPLDRTGFLPISKSGGTPETIAATFAALGALEAKVGKAGIKNQVLAITEAADNPLRRLMTRLGCTILEHDPKVGGRYSALSLVGMLPAMIAGVDGAAVREGAASVLDPVLAAKDTKDLAPAIGAALSVGLSQERGTNITVLMPYVDRLETFAFWYRQIWAESLGKQGKGTTPVRAMGTIDQHSQVQLYLGGPHDKLYTFVIQDTAGQGTELAPATLGGDKALDYLAGHTMGDLLLAEADATAATLVKDGRPVRVIRIETIDERVMGALMMHYMLETMFAAELWGIDAFDQPAVEDGKVLTRQYLSQRRKS